MNYNELEKLLQSVQSDFSQLKNYRLYHHKTMIDVAYLQIVDNMLSREFLRFLLSLDCVFAVFPSDSDTYNYDIQFENCFVYAK